MPTQQNPHSLAAWQSIQHCLSEIDEQIVTILDSGPSRGMMSHEIEKVTGRSHQSVSANLSRLRQRGIVAECGKGKTPSNRHAAYYILV